jgi:hypothetical protein
MYGRPYITDLKQKQQEFKQHLVFKVTAAHVSPAEPLCSNAMA